MKYELLFHTFNQILFQLHPSEPVKIRAERGGAFIGRGNEIFQENINPSPTPPLSLPGLLVLFHLHLFMFRYRVDRLLPTFHLRISHLSSSLPTIQEIGDLDPSDFNGSYFNASDSNASDFNTCNFDTGEFNASNFTSSDFNATESMLVILELQIQC